MRRGLLGIAIAASVCAAVGLAAAPARAISIAGFGAGGEAGSVRGLPISFGTGGDVFELDAWLSLGGAAQQLSSAGAPAGIGFAFAADLSADGTDLVLRYSFENQGGSALDLTFLSFVDAEIDEPLNTFFNEFATEMGSLAPGQSFEVDEPGFAFGDLPANLAAGALDGTNAVPASAPEDVAMALSFEITGLLPGDSAIFEVLLSEDGDFLGTFALVQQDADPGSQTTLTYSGIATVAAGDPTPAIPEPGAAALFAVGLAVVARSLRR